MALIFAAAVALYWSSLRHPPVFDDLTLHEQAFAAPQARVTPRWISAASFRAVHAIAGESLYWQRLVNVVLHAATAAALFGFLARLFRHVLADPRAGWYAFAGALFFVLHPVAVYGVAYLAERSIVMATLFSLFALWCVLEGLLAKKAAWYAAAALAYALAVSSKEHAVMVPALAAALAVLVHGVSLQLARRLAWVFAAFALAGVVVVLQLRHVLGTAYEPFAADVLGRDAQRGAIDVALAWPLSIVNQAALFFRYLATWLLPWPGWMSIDVRTPFPASLLGWPHAAGFVAWIALPILAAWLLMKRSGAGLAGFALLGAWLYALTEFVTVRAQEPFVLYRSYLWMSVLPAALPALAARVPLRIGAVLLAAACIALAAAARDRIDTFSSALKLWDDAANKIADVKAPYAERALIARGMVLLDLGRLDAARADIARARTINPRSPDAWLASGALALRTGRAEDALRDLGRAIALDPRYASAYDKRCVAYATLARPAEALADCVQATALDPRNHEAWINAGVAYRALGRRAEAAASYERALELAPRDGAANYNYGVLLLEAGRRDEAVRRRIVIGCEAGIANACDILRRSRSAP